MIYYIILFLILQSSFSAIFMQTFIGKISLILILIYSLCLLITNSFRLNKRDLCIVIILNSLIFFKILIQGVDFTEIGYIIKITSIFIICNFKSMEETIEKLDNILSFLCKISLIGFILVNSLLKVQIEKFSYLINDYKTWYLFYGYRGERSYQNAGFTWEPSIFASIVAIFLFYNLVGGNPKRLRIQRVILYTVVLVSTKSTAGIILLSLNYFYFTYFRLKNKILMLLLLVFLIFNPYTREKVVQKIQSREKIEGNFSAQAREMHKIIDLEIFKENIILGMNTKEETKIRYEMTKKLSIKNEIIKKFLNLQTEYDITSNSLTGILSNYGVIIFIINYYLYFRFFFKERKIENLFFCMILITTFASQYIVFYPFYMIFWYLPKSFFSNLKIQE